MIFSKIEFVDQSKPCTQIYLHNIASCINLQLPIVILKKKQFFLDMHHHKTYMYINFQQNRIKTQVITVLTSIFAKNRKLHKFATTSNHFFKIDSFRQASSEKRTCISIFSKIGLVDRSKPCTQIYLQKTASCINLQLPIVTSKNQFSLDMHHHKTYMYINFQQNQVKTQVVTACGLLDNRKKKLLTQTDGRQTSRTTTIGSFFEKKTY